MPVALCLLHRRIALLRARRLSADRSRAHGATFSKTPRSAGGWIADADHHWTAEGALDGRESWRPPEAGPVQEQARRRKDDRGAQAITSGSVVRAEVARAEACRGA